MRGVLVVAFACGCGFRSGTVDAGNVSPNDGAMRDAPAIDATSSRTVTFQQGIAGYTGAQDTFLDQSMPDTQRGTIDQFECDTDAVMGLATIGLLRFDAIVGSNADQVRPGATIEAASLTLQIADGTFSASLLRASQTTWAQTSSTWNNFGGEPGVQGDELGPTIDQVPGTLPGEQVLDVTASITAWVGGAPNHGWVLMPTSFDGLNVWSSEQTIAALRPRLEVTFH